MGGDHAPREVVQGALRALESDADLHVTLVGREEVIAAELGGAYDPKRLAVLHAAEVIDCNESPADALRKKRDSSVVRGMKLVAERQADAFVSAGSTGAAVGAATLILRLIPGVLKAGIAVVWGSRDRYTMLTDVGANVYCKPIHLLHYGTMASVYAERVLGVARPRVALLNIGTEEAKGNDLVKETRELFEHAPFNFIGHVEGNDLFEHRADVVVCEGFVGNVVLKVIEGLSEFLHSSLENLVEPTIGAKTAGAHELVSRFKTIGDYAEVGGAPLLGVNGTVLICHGRSDRRAIGNALKLAARFVRSGALAAMADGLKSHQAT
jgi:phosphate acyltransferase